MDDLKIPLPKFLNELTKNGVPVPKAMTVAGKIYQDYNTPSGLRQLTDVKLNAAGVQDKQLRRLVLSALRKAGYGPTRRRTPVSTAKSSGSQEAAIESPISALETVTTPTKKKRKASEDKNEFLPPPSDEAAAYGSLDFNEMLDEETLRTKSTVINRAPLMSAWATVVAERMGFQREEALSIASVYTEMNAISKGISLGIFDEKRSNGIEADKAGSQPYVELMGRSALYKIQNGQWRALLNNEPALPSTAFSYIARSFRQTAPYVVGALRLLAASFSPQEINEKAWSLYTDFRPSVDGWGKRGPVSCETILSLRKKVPKLVSEKDGTNTANTTAGMVKFYHVEERERDQTVDDETDMSGRKRSRELSLDEYEAALDADPMFNDVDLDVGL